MKKLLCVVLMIGALVGLALFLPSKSTEYDFLRLSVCANSNMALDQGVKYAIKDELLKTLEPVISNVASKKQAIEVVNAQKNKLILACKQILKQNNLNYAVNVKICNQFFEKQTYANTTIESGNYDAVVVELGDAVGENWWCVIYPPLAFNKKSETKITFKSKIVEWFKGLFN